VLSNFRETRSGQIKKNKKPVKVGLSGYLLLLFFERIAVIICIVRFVPVAETANTTTVIGGFWFFLFF